jgi:hypothetical protein
MDLPSVIETYWYAFDWDVETLWALDLPTVALPIAKLEWHLDVPVWAHDGQNYVLTPRDVLKSPYRYASEYRRTQAASLVFPVEITWYRGRWLILDGIHRLLKAHEQAHDVMMVRKVPKKHLRFDA